MSNIVKNYRSFKWHDDRVKQFASTPKYPQWGKMNKYCVTITRVYGIRLIIFFVSRFARSQNRVKSMSWSGSKVPTRFNFDHQRRVRYTSIGNNKKPSVGNYNDVGDGFVGRVQYNNFNRRTSFVRKWSET